MARKSRFANKQRSKSAQRIVDQGKFMLCWIALLWILEILDVVLGHRLDNFGIEPRRLASLPAIFTAPFLHYGFGHVAANSVPLFVLGWLTLATGRSRFWTVSFVIVVVSGLAVWLLGRGSVGEGLIVKHAGASLLIFGYFGFLVVYGFIRRSPLWIVVAIAVGLIYGASMLGGVVPGQDQISWEGHLFGLLAGVLAAYLLKKDKGKFKR
ncbi:MAG: membrane associated rhomboid family serine protease [Verrucomicrobiales bacterium]|jgi:membrane associated rhomboid family serine protease